ncbi:hypothetical protein JCM8547_009023 [Rhodosporidiobolus lusitaniae]
MSGQSSYPSQASIAAAMDGPSYPNPNVQGNPYIYLAVYSSVPVYEMMVRGIGVMRRRVDSWLNATQILKVAGVDKGKRTKILEKDIAQGIHEKVQGGYGRYQGTWIPFERAVELANAYGVSHLLAPLFDYTAPPPPVSHNGGAPPPPISNPYAMAEPVPTLPAPPMQQMPSQQQHQPPQQDASAILQHARQQGLLPSPDEQLQPQLPVTGPSGHKRMGDVLSQEDLKRSRSEPSNGFNGISSYNGTPASSQLAASTSQQQHLPPLVDARPLTNFRTTLTPSTQNPTDLATMDPALLERNRTALKSIFPMDAEQSGPSGSGAPPPDLSSIFPSDLDPDTPIDENLHTALHWASALARTSLVQALVNFGADKHRGNNVGETPLIRAVLVTNNSDQDSFPRLLEVLASSLHTVDEAGRSVLHHAALVAGVKGRATSARYYLDTVLAFVAAQEKKRGVMSSFVDAQDSHGDTALNIAARGGNKALCKSLLLAGADKLKSNKLGLRPVDYGVDEPELSLSNGELLTPPPPFSLSSSVPSERSQDVLTALTSRLDVLRGTFQSELTSKTADLVSKRSHLHDLTRELASQRRELARWRKEVDRTEEAAQRVKNLQDAVDEEDAFDWTGRTEIDGSPASQLAGPGFTYRGPGSTLLNVPSGAGMEFDADPPLPETENGVVTGEALVHLLRLQAWYERVEGLMRQRVEKLEGGNQEMESKMRRIVAGVVGVEEDKVDGMLESLVQSMETDATTRDLTRVAAFLSRVKDGSLA